MHASAGVREDQGTTFVNASMVQGSYEPVGDPVFIDLDAEGVASQD